MTAIVASGRSLIALWCTAIAMSVVALGARSVDRWSWVVPVAGGTIGLAVPAIVRRAALLAWVAVTVTGILVFVVARTFWTLPPSGGRWALGAAVATAVGEEILFRRALYALLEPWGARVAVAGSSLAFALVHVPMYGWKALGVNLAASVLFGWQRWATGSWTSPAATHAAANIVQFL